jgi:hypothetical protein
VFSHLVLMSHPALQAVSVSSALGSENHNQILVWVAGEPSECLVMLSHFYGSTNQVERETCTKVQSEETELGFEPDWCDTKAHSHFPT